jgi:hypothetical protein
MTMSGLSQNETATGGLFAAPARAGFVNWVNDTLGIERTANVLWDMEAGVRLSDLSGYTRTRTQPEPALPNYLSPTGRRRLERESPIPDG